MVLNVHKPEDPTGAILEAWAQGCLVGALVVMICVTLANMRRHILLHKLILVELSFGLLHGTFILTNPPVYNWYLSSTAILLDTSWSLHNVIAWMKSRPFLSKKWSLFYICTVILVQPYWVTEIVANFLYFSDTNSLFEHTRPWEALARDPWWIFTILNLFYNIRSRYELGYFELVRVSPRFGVLLSAMLVSIAFIILDILSVTGVLKDPGLPDGVNPFWKWAFIFKCLTDTIILDDFKTALDKLKHYKFQQSNSLFSDGFRGDFSYDEQQSHKRNENSPDHLMLTNPAAVRAQDWSRSNKNEDSQHIDLEAALRLDTKEMGESSRSSAAASAG